MKIFNISILVYVGILTVSIGALFSIKCSVGNLHNKLSNISKEVKEIEKTIQVLEAEWSYLTQPVYLEKLAEKHLKLEPILYSQVNNSLDTEYSLLASAR